MNMLAIDNIQSIHNTAMEAAQQASKNFADKHFNGRDGGPCGFAWVTVLEKGNTKLGRSLKEVGFRKSYRGGLQLWNRWWPGQSVDAAEHGAVAYAAVLKQFGIDAYADSRLD